MLPLPTACPHTVPPSSAATLDLLTRGYHHHLTQRSESLSRSRAGPRSRRAFRGLDGLDGLILRGVPRAQRPVGSRGKPLPVLRLSFRAFSDHLVERLALRPRHVGAQRLDHHLPRLALLCPWQRHGAPLVLVYPLGHAIDHLLGGYALLPIHTGIGNSRGGGTGGAGGGGGAGTGGGRRTTTLVAAAAAAAGAGGGSGGGNKGGSSSSSAGAGASSSSGSSGASTPAIANAGVNGKQRIPSKKMIDRMTKRIYEDERGTMPLPGTEESEAWKMVIQSLRTNVSRTQRETLDQMIRKSAETEAEYWERFPTAPNWALGTGYATQDETIKAIQATERAAAARPGA
mmetsp:Transcript_19154/g.47827  ORF Transcript_19154/g.47827 Transcript_19154/m.47827 type:complete len:344 (-) Transcript_19154:285-1316(-)